jgi:hypothetical protein
VRRSHRARLDRLSAARDEAERAAAKERRMLRRYALIYPALCAAMLRGGLDPAESSAMRDIAEQLAGFVDTPELRRADAEAAAAEKSGKEPVLVDGTTPQQALIALLDQIGRRYKENGTQPNLCFASFWELLAWATPPDDSAAPAINDAPAKVVEGGDPEAAAPGSAPAAGTAVRVA